MLDNFDMTNSDDFPRGLLWFLKNNPDEKNPEKAKAFFDAFKFSVFIDPNDANDPAHQICLLTIVNAASRIALPSGSANVQVFGVNGQKRNDNSGLSGTLEDAIKEVGGVCEQVYAPDETLGIAIGNAEGSSCKFCIRAVFEGWRGGIVPHNVQNPFDKTSPIPLGAILAAGLAIYECFRFVNKEGSAIGHRTVGMSLWDFDEKDWMQTSNAESDRIDTLSPMWFCGLGHLGQAYIWTLGHLPIADRLRSDNQIIIQDKDLTSPSNLSTSLLTSPATITYSKTLLCNDWLHKRNFSNVVMVERFITPESEINFGDFHLICGLDNPKARRQAALRRPVLMIDGGIGGGINDFQSLAMHTLPSNIDPRRVWPDNDANFSGDMPLSLKAYHESEDSTVRCGIETLNNKAVGFPFVGVVTASVVMAELLRRSMKAHHYQRLSMDMRDVAERTYQKIST